MTSGAAGPRGAGSPARYPGVAAPEAALADPTRFWDRRAEKYARQPIRDPASYEKTLERTRAHLGPSDTVLELGCGTGSTALLLAPSVKEIVGTDFSAGMIEIARRKVAAQAVSNVRFEVATAFDDRLAPGSFDVVLAFNFLHLVEDLPGMVRRVHALLRPGGRFVSKTVCLAEQSRLYRPLLAVLRAVGFAPTVRCLRVAELEGIVTAAGFEIVETGSYPPAPPSRFLVART